MSVKKILQLLAQAMRDSGDARDSLTDEADALIAALPDEPAYERKAHDIPGFQVGPGCDRERWSAEALKGAAIVDRAAAARKYAGWEPQVETVPYSDDVMFVGADHALYHIKAGELPRKISTRPTVDVEGLIAHIDREHGSDTDPNLADTIRAYFARQDKSKAEHEVGDCDAGEHLVAPVGDGAQSTVVTPCSAPSTDTASTGAASVAAPSPVSATRIDSAPSGFRPGQQADWVAPAFPPPMATWPEMYQTRGPWPPASPALMPCPWCKKSAKLCPFNSGYCSCSDDDCGGGSHWIAIAAWNKRAPGSVSERTVEDIERESLDYRKRVGDAPAPSKPGEWKRYWVGTNKARFGDQAAATIIKACDDGSSVVLASATGKTEADALRACCAQLCPPAAPSVAWEMVANEYARLRCERTGIVPSDWEASCSDVRHDLRKALAAHTVDTESIWKQVRAVINDRSDVPSKCDDRRCDEELEDGAICNAELTDGGFGKGWSCQACDLRDRIEDLEARLYAAHIDCSRSVDVTADDLEVWKTFAVSGCGYDGSKDFNPQFCEFINARLRSRASAPAQPAGVPESVLALVRGTFFMDGPGLTAQNLARIDLASLSTGSHVLVAKDEIERLRNKLKEHSCVTPISEGNGSLCGGCTECMLQQASHSATEWKSRAERAEAEVARLRDAEPSAMYNVAEVSRLQCVIRETRAVLGSDLSGSVEGHAKRVVRERDEAQAALAKVREENREIRSGPNGLDAMKETIAKVWAEIPPRADGQYIHLCVRELREERDALQAQPARAVNDEDGAWEMHVAIREANGMKPDPEDIYKKRPTLGMIGAWRRAKELILPSAPAVALTGCDIWCAKWSGEPSFYASVSQPEKDHDDMIASRLNTLLAAKRNGGAA